MQYYENFLYHIVFFLKNIVNNDCRDAMHCVSTEIIHSPACYWGIFCTFAESFQH